MSEKAKIDLKTFIESINKKDKNHNGTRVNFSWKRGTRIKK